MNIKARKMNLIDNFGRQRIFNGINIVFKGKNDESVVGGREYTRAFTQQQFTALKDKGINLIRFGIVWDAIEHTMGEYNEAYLAWVEETLDMCKAAGISVYLDMHQDLYSRIFDGGAPEWATLTDGAPHIEGDLWSEAYLVSQAVNKAYRNFWENKETEAGKGLQEHYEQLWEHVLRRIGQHDAVVGYDFLNEPFPGKHSLEIMGTLLMTYCAMTGQDMTPEKAFESFADDAFKGKMLEDITDENLYRAVTEQCRELIQEFDSTELAAFYQRMTAKLREMTSDGLVFTENNYFSNMGIESHVQRITLEGQAEPNQVYSPHGYDLVVDTPAVVYANNHRIKVILDAHKRVQERLGVPVIFGEWGAHCQYKDGLEHIQFILNYFDENQWSHTYYCWEDNFETFPVAEMIARPYPQAVAGNIEKYGYDFATKTFELKWTQDASINEPTVIYLPSKPDEVHTQNKFEIKEEGEGFRLFVDGNNESEGTVRLVWN